MCRGFGKFCKYELVKNYRSSETIIKLLVENCNLLLVPSLYSLKDFGLAYPVMISLLPVEDVNPLASPNLHGQVQSGGSWGLDLC